MKIRIAILDQEAMAGVDAKVRLPLWARPHVCIEYGPCLAMAAYWGSDLLGVWTVPLSTVDGGMAAARRSCRLLPYAAPVLFVDGNLMRRKVVDALFGELTSRVHEVDLPLAPGFLDTGAFLKRGAVLLWKHTHILTQSWVISMTAPRVRNHIRHACRLASVEVWREAGGFHFDRAIIDESADGISRRSRLGNKLLSIGEAYYLEARAGGRIIGQAFVTTDTHYHYLFHSWFDRVEARGVPSLLIEQAARESFSMSADLDLEGSVLPGVDEFYCGLEAHLVSYCHLEWTNPPKEVGGGKYGIFRTDCTERAT
jgi:hypothetical protein